MVLRLESLLKQHIHGLFHQPPISFVLHIESDLNEDNLAQQATSKIKNYLASDMQQPSPFPASPNIYPSFCTTTTTSSGIFQAKLREDGNSKDDISKSRRHEHVLEVLQRRPKTRSAKRGQSCSTYKSEHGKSTRVRLGCFHRTGLSLVLGGRLELSCLKFSRRKASQRL